MSVSESQALDPHVTEKGLEMNGFNKKMKELGSKRLTYDGNESLADD